MIIFLVCFSPFFVVTVEKRTLFPCIWNILNSFNTRKSLHDKPVLLLFYGLIFSFFSEEYKP